jgi:hypothetical protein
VPGDIVGTKRSKTLDIMGVPSRKTFFVKARKFLNRICLTFSVRKE